MYFLELVKHEGKSLGWSTQNKRGFEAIIRHAKSNFDSLSPLRQLRTLKSSRQNNVTWFDFQQGKQVELSLARATRSLKLWRSRFALLSKVHDRASRS